MAGRVQIHLVEAALLALLPDALKVEYGENVDVNTMSKGDFADNGQLVMKSPAVRVFFDSASNVAARDTTRTTMNRDQMWSIFCLHQSLRGRATERTKALQLVGAVENILAGARLKMEDGTYTEPILLQGVNQAVDVAGPVDQCYAVSFMVTGLATFTGTYSNFGAKA